MCGTIICITFCWLLLCGCRVTVFLGAGLWETCARRTRPATTCDPARTQSFSSPHRTPRTLRTNLIRPLASTILLSSLPTLARSPRRMSIIFFFSSRRRHTRLQGDWSSDVCSSDLAKVQLVKIDQPMTVEQFNQKYPSNLKVEEVALINGLDAPASPMQPGQTYKHIEIGRASCRERV